MEYLPLFVHLKNRSVLVIGGGDVATRKVKILLKTGAKIKIVASALCLELKKLSLLKNIDWIGLSFCPKMLKKVTLVIIATNNSTVNTLVYQEAEKKYILVNTVDDKNNCSCIFPAIIDRAPILIGISSCGTAPVLIRILREKLESLLPNSIGYVAKIAGVWRNTVKRCIPDITHRRWFWEKIFYNGCIANLVEKGKFSDANQTMQRAISNIKSSNHHIKKEGRVTLVGAGPGDTGLLTVKGLQIIQQADVILYDHLVNIDILDLARRDANKICVGKAAGNQNAMSQVKLNCLIVQLARQGNNVVRLKGGDSFIFGRGGEELQIISESGINFQVVPGVTAGIGVAAYAGIPLTHREYAHSVTFMTGHQIYDMHQMNRMAFSDNKQTLVIYMGKLNAMNIKESLIKNGKNIDTPVAVISRGTYQNQKILIGILLELEKLASMAESPVLFIIGNVVSLHKKIGWFGQKNVTYMSREYKC